MRLVILAEGQNDETDLARSLGQTAPQHHWCSGGFEQAFRHYEVDGEGAVADGVKEDRHLVTLIADD
jgi:hypothetical protein